MNTDRAAVRIHSTMHPIALVGSLILLFFRDRLGLELSADHLLEIFAALACAGTAIERRSIAPRVRDALAREGE